MAFPIPATASPSFVPRPSSSPVPDGASPAGARHLYVSLLAEHGGPGRADEVTRAASRVFLGQQLEAARRLDLDLPAGPDALPGWLERGHAETASRFRDYLDGRKAGAPRRFFANRSHALHFLMSVAPTKLVDGAWLYGLLERTADARLHPLIRTYLEELGDGVPDRNHVTIYRQLLAPHGTDRWQRLDDTHHLQGAIQLALAHHGADFLPELIGFNLGYEQLPLHLPITAYELNELGIDPHYFGLHVTIDNASTGHAAKAIQVALAMLPRAGDAAGFYRRMMDGFGLNELGFGTTAAIASFDLDRELFGVMVDKARIGATLHSDRCRIAGRTVCDWLSTPGAMPAFLAALQSTGWIRRGVAPSESRFWRLLQDARAPMFGVFDGYELQLIEDWILDGEPGAGAARPGGSRPQPIQDARVASPHVDADPAPARSADLGVERLVRKALADAAAAGDPDLEFLARRLGEAAGDREATIGVLRPFLSPANHPTPAGLAATRIFARLVGP